MIFSIPVKIRSFLNIRMDDLRWSLISQIGNLRALTILYIPSMSEEKPRIARLTAIIAQLQSSRLVTAREIADRHQVSIRTIYRDIRTLEQSGVPIHTEEGQGYKILDSYRLPPVMFSEEEAYAMITAEQLIQKNKDASLIAHYSNAAMKIKAVLKYSQKEKTELLTQRIQVRNNRTNEKTSHYLIQLQKAISDFQAMQLDYLSLDQQSSQRTIEPFALYTTKDNWILIAFCRSKQDFRAFRLDRIQALEPLNIRFQPHDMTLQQYLDQCREKY